MKISVLRSRKDWEMDVDFERSLEVTNMDYDEYGCTIYTKEMQDVTVDGPMKEVEVMYYFVLDNDCLEALRNKMEE